MLSKWKRTAANIQKGIRAQPSKYKIRVFALDFRGFSITLRPPVLRRQSWKRRRLRHSSISQRRRRGLRPRDSKRPLEQTDNHDARPETRTVIWSAAARCRFHLSRSDGSAVAVRRCRRRHLGIRRSLLTVGCWSVAVRRRARRAGKYSVTLNSHR